jgi:ribose transport system permease protein
MRRGVLIAFVLTIVVFSALRPETFPTWTTAQQILEAAAIPLIVAIGVTSVLIVGQFDLSVGAVMGLTMAVAVTLIAEQSVPWVLALLIAVAAGGLFGALNGLIVAGIGAAGFIATLATASIATAVEIRLTDQKSIFEGLPAAFGELSTDRFLDLSILVWIAFGFTALTALFFALTVPGRGAYAAGGNETAAHLAGIPVKRLKILAFTIAGLAAGLGGVLIAAQSASYFPNAGGGYLLPSYAAAFLGLAAFSDGRFRVLGTVLGVLFLQVTTTGLASVDAPPWTVNLVQGLVLLAAVLLSQVGQQLLGRGRRA